MFNYVKKLQYPINIKNPDPKAASIIISQYGGPDGELGASLRYLSQRYSMPYPELKGLLTDIGVSFTEWRNKAGNLCIKTCRLPWRRVLKFIYFCYNYNKKVYIYCRV